ncbi:STAS domain-containing protein [Cellulosilyticum ruminicola]|uniref:STAS domain-containing protein n=1 Tax=Cellulosilyticum ruminicola TaxID=425254 RepID=UPI0006D203CC|nr:anti-sigma factor antagonist [Cellulosilyticum ruminicola]
MNVEYFTQDKTLIVCIGGEIDHHTCKLVKDDIERAYSKGSYKHMLFDFEYVEFMDSSGIGLLMGRVKSAALLGGQVGLYNASPKVERLLSMSGITKIVHVYKNKLQALKALT